MKYKLNLHKRPNFNLKRDLTLTSKKKTFKQ